MERKIRLIFILILLIIFYINKSYILNRLVVPDIMQWKTPSQKTPLLYGDKIVSQNFVSNFNGLFRIGFLVEYGKFSGEEIEVDLYEKETNRQLYKEVIPLNKFLKNRMYRVTFSPQWDSGGKTYRLSIKAPQATPDTGIRLMYDPGPFFHVKTKGRLYFDNKELLGELSMVTECRTRVNKEGFISFWINFLSDRGFVIFYAGLLVIGMGSLIALFK